MEDQFRERYTQAFSLLEKGEAPQARDELRALSEAGYPPAQAFLGWLYESGKGGPRDRGEARRWYTASSLAENPLGEFYLGVMNLQDGNLPAGAELVRRSAQKDYPPALYRLGLVYERGMGVPVDVDEAYRCFERAGSLGHPFAQRRIALRLLRGHAGILGILRGIWWFMRVPWIGIKLIREDKQYLLYP